MKNLLKIFFTTESATPSALAMLPAILPAALVALCVSIVTATAAGSQTIEDFGPYSSNPAQDAKKHLEALGDWNASVNGYDEAINNFYTRTGIPASDDPIQQLLDIDMAGSAEREARRMLSDNASEAVQNYAYAIAPWLKEPAVVVAVTEKEVPVNDMLDERSLLTSAISSLNSTLKGLSDTVDILY